MYNNSWLNQQQKTTEIGESQYVNLSTNPNITFSKGFVVSREVVVKPIDGDKNSGILKTDIKKVYQQMQAMSNSSSESINMIALENISNSECIIESDDLSSGDLVSKMKDFSKYFKHYTRYVVDFNHVAKPNISQLALGGRDPYNLDWVLEIEPFS